MPLTQYHNNLSRWYRQYIIDLVSDIPDYNLWTKFPHINSPGWTLTHLIVEGELAISKIKPRYKVSIENYEKFVYGSDGNVRSELSLNELLQRFKEVYELLEAEVTGKMDSLNSEAINDESLKAILKTELDFYLHMLTTHIAMHCDALYKWRFSAEMKRPYE